MFDSGRSIICFSSKRGGRDELEIHIPLEKDGTIHPWRVGGLIYLIALRCGFEALEALANAAILPRPAPVPSQGLAVVPDWPKEEDLPEGKEER